MENKNAKKRILVIEDEPIISLIAVRVLRAEGFDVDIANNGKAAKSMSDKVLHYLYLYDIKTPTMNGMEFYDYLSRLHPGRESRIIFTTGDTLSHEIKAFLNDKDNLFLAKPFTPEELRVVIQKALKTRGN